ncbi:MAG: phytoene/squalene synthase family protein [Pseudolabrys sp.]
MNMAGHCAALVREYDRDRYLATLFAPADRRDALLALYAFAVEIGRVRDVAREPMPGEIRLQWWREVLEGARDGEAAAHPVAAALRAAIAEHGLDVSRLTAFVDAHSFDLYDEPFRTLDDLDNHAVLTEGLLLAGAAKVLGQEGFAVDALTRHAGIALTVFGAVLALPKHAARGQLYIPLEVLDRHRVDRAAVFAGKESAELLAALAELRRHARRQLTAAAMEAGETPAAIMPALLPVALIGPTFRRMDRRGYEPFAPEPLSRIRRQWLLWRAARDTKRIFAA